MSWWSSSDVEKEILRATSSSIPSGEQDLALNLEISDSVRSKAAPAEEVLKIMRKRLYDRNPNVQILTLHLLDLLVKNGGQHFFIESVRKEFVDSYIAQLMSLVNQNRNPEVVELMLEYFQTWALASKTKPEAQYLRDKYEDLKKRREIEFPDPSSFSELSSSYLEAATAPEWTDSETCMKSGQPFTFYNRKHHCRCCGGVFIQQYCSNFRPLPQFGINIPVRICSDCDEKMRAKYESHSRSSRNDDDLHRNKYPNVQSSGGKPRVTSNNRDIGSKYQEELDQAIKLSLQASQHPKSILNTAGSNIGEEDDMDEEVKRAIEASLREMGSQGGQVPQPGPQAVQSVQPTEIAKKDAPLLRIRSIVEDFHAALQLANPRDAIYNPNLIDLNRKAIGIQPQIITELRGSSSKLGALEDLHGKLIAVSNYYDRLLEAELNPELQIDNRFASVEPLQQQSSEQHHNQPRAEVNIEQSSPRKISSQPEESRSFETEARFQTSVSPTDENLVADPNSGLKRSSPEPILIEF